MMDEILEQVLLPAIEQPDLTRLGALEDKEHPITAYLTLKCGDAFLVTDTCGDLLSSRQEMGLFRHGTRFLRTCNLYLESQPLVMLSHQASNMGDACHIDLTNVPLTIEDAEIEQGVIHIDRFLELEQDYLLQTLTVTNFHHETVSVKLSLKIGADFCDLFEVRGFTRKAHGKIQPSITERSEVALRYLGLDEVERATHVQFEPSATTVQSDRIDWELNLKRGQPLEIRIMLKMCTSNAERFTTGKAMTLWRDLSEPTLYSDDPLFNRLLTRGIHDLMMLTTMTPHGYYPYAGIPWFSCPFGRDGLLTALEFLPLYPQVARGTLEFLAAYQGKKVDAFTDEEPGKILHEFRTGEMANCREIPYLPYYGTVDATPLFIIVLEAYIRWTNDLDFLERMWPHVEAAGYWLTNYGDKDGDSFIEYHRASEKGLNNQGWKDAWDSISYSNGQIAHSPLALCEVQGYAFAAYQAMSNLARMLGKMQEIVLWEQTARILQENFLKHFWWEEEQSFYLGLGENKRPCDVVASNAGQCLWTGIVPQELARKVMDRLMREDMFSGWGIRTLSTTAKRYNPMSYHNGSVWPHDTALVGNGFAQYGGKVAAGQLLKGLFDASNFYEGARLPELYCGFPRRPGYGPTRYPVSCSPQAWAAGAPVILITALLGLHPNAAEHRLTLHQPTLPDWLKTLEIRGMHIGKDHVHLRFVRVGERTEVVLGRDNEVDVRVL